MQFDQSMLDFAISEWRCISIIVRLCGTHFGHKLW